MRYIYIYTTGCVSVSSHFGRQKNLSAVCFSCISGSFWDNNLLCWDFKNRYPKKPVSFTKIDICDHIYCLIYISLGFYCSEFGCQNPSRMTTLRPKLRILGHNANSLGLLNPENWPWHCPTTYLKAKKGDISPWTIQSDIHHNYIFH